MPEPYAWKCICGETNSLNLGACLKCQAPRVHGRPLFAAPEPFDLSAWLWGIVLAFVVLTFIGVFSLGTFILALLVGLLTWIGTGVWRLVDKR